MTAARTGLVVGMGVSGLSVAAHWLRAQNPSPNTPPLARIVAVDNRDSPPCASAFAQLADSASAVAELTCQFPEHYPQWQDDEWNEYDVIALSPGVAPPLASRVVDKSDATTAAACPLKSQWTNDAHIFSQQWQQCAPASSRLFAVTGTNGKSSVVALAKHICTAAGLTAEAVGNIGAPLGMPMLDALHRWQAAGVFPQVVIAELSSFHLEVAQDFYSDGAVVLNVGQDHLDRHESKENYARIKRLVYQQTRRVVVNIGDSALASAQTESSHTYSPQGADAQADWFINEEAVVCRSNGMRFERAAMSSTCQRMLENVAATLALLADLNLPAAKIGAGLASFSSLPHRLQQVASINGVAFINDSKATNTEAVVFALATLQQQAVLIAGGIRKGSFAALSQVKQYLQYVFIIGQESAAIAAELNALQIPHIIASDLSAAVRHAYAAAQAGDVVLLSPGGASFDSFKNYQHRGEAFMQAVGGLLAQQEGGQ